MRKHIYLLLIAMAISSLASAQRFLSEIFPSANKTSDIKYGRNVSVFTGSPVPTDLYMDVYQPGGAADPMPSRPLIVFMHTGSYIPAFINESPTGSRNDSATAEMCRQFARRGYVVANIDYRMGWNPQSLSVDVRKGTLLQAVYRSIQDAKAAVRFFKADAAGANVYKIDSTRIILGGQGTGGYIALNYVALHDTAQLQISKFKSGSDQPLYDIYQLQCYINASHMGDLDGHGGLSTLNIDSNSNGHTSNVAFAFNLGGAIGDSTWITNTSGPMVSFHCKKDQFAPYLTDMVFVPVLNLPVVVVSGSGWVIPKADALGNNNCFAPPPAYTDAYSLRANMVNGGADGLFPFETDSAEGSPWEWFDSTATVQFGTTQYGYTVGHCDTIYANAKLSNWNMSKTKALKYIDTIMNYLNPRLQRCLGLPLWPAGVQQLTLNANDVQVYPNPADAMVNVQSNVVKLDAISVTDMTGRVVRNVEGVNQMHTKVNLAGLSPGIYFMTVNTDAGSITKKLSIR